MENKTHPARVALDADTHNEHILRDGLIAVELGLVRSAPTGRSSAWLRDTLAAQRAVEALAVQIARAKREEV